MPQKFFSSLCVPIIERSAEQAIAIADKASKKALWLEFRLDHLSSLSQIPILLKGLSSRRFRRNRLIFTLRRREAGGRFRGSIRAQINWLEKTAVLREWIDLEVETVRKFGVRGVENLKKAGSRVVVSYHNFKKTPFHLEAIADQLLSTNSDMIKIATLANSLADCARLLDLQAKLRRQKQRSVVLGMGATGLPTRLLGPSRGAEFTFTALKSGKSSAPGQCTLEDLLKRYRIDRINSTTRLFGILGHPLEHSLSPELYNTAFHCLGINAAFLPFDTVDLEDFPDWTRQLKLNGLSVTLPHKSAVMKFCQRLDPLAEKAGAANTIVRQGSRWTAYNTDMLGIAGALEKHKVALAGTRVLLLGAGGAARAAAAWLALKKSRVSICSRTHRSAVDLARQFSHQAIRPSQLSGQHFDLVINATPAGMWPRTSAVPLDVAKIKASVVFDMVYNPPRTRLLQHAQKQGALTISGLEMFQAQAEAQFEIMTRQPLPPGIWRRLKADNNP
jgi:3-dehydroquinate dehydratase/shikimate dehydrogenase